MEENEHEVELIDYIEVLLKHKWLIATVTVICGLAVWISSLTSPRQYESQALVLVSQPIASTHSAGNEETGAAGSVITVSGMAVRTYEALAKGEELMQSLRDTMLAQDDLELDVRRLLTETNIETISTLLSAELVKETEGAESPLLAFGATSGVETLPVPLVNMWTKLFMERHRGLSSNFADSYYQWVEGQHATARENLETTEDLLRELTTSYSDLSVLETAIGIKTGGLGTALVDYQNLGAELETLERELIFIRSQLAQVEQAGEWLGYTAPGRLPQRSMMVGDTPRRRQLVVTRWNVQEAISDSLRVAEQQNVTRRDYHARQRSRLLKFEQATRIDRARQQAKEYGVALSLYRMQAVQFDREIKGLDTDLQVLTQNLAREPTVLMVGKAIVDEQLWEQAVSSRGLEPRLQAELGKYRLLTESLNPIYQELSAELRTKQIAYDRAVLMDSTLAEQIPWLERELLAVQGRADSLTRVESDLLSESARERVAMNDSLGRAEQPVHARLGRERKSLAEQRQSYLRLKAREVDVSLQIMSLVPQVEYEKRDFDHWSAQLQKQDTIADSLLRERSNLRSALKVFQTTFTRFTALLEEARIARGQAAGDIQIVARAVVARPVARGTVKKAAISALVGLMASVMLAFLLEYMAKARAGRRAGVSDPS
jgi:capsular polysaccharide biosynthesis protein